mmetsp:Transcript_63004/g.186078  ORF Transcript_63004/g.186078 Transcript_63004/m.186078 type:complete len:601 (-) Transcript_63004:588-2390(-)
MLHCARGHPGGIWNIGTVRDAVEDAHRVIDAAIVESSGLRLDGDGALPAVEVVEMNVLQGQAPRRPEDAVDTVRHPLHHVVPGAMDRLAGSGHALLELGPGPQQPRPFNDDVGRELIPHLTDFVVGRDTPHHLHMVVHVEKYAAVAVAVHPQVLQDGPLRRIVPVGVGRHAAEAGGMGAVVLELGEGGFLTMIGGEVPIGGGRTAYGAVLHLDPEANVSAGRDVPLPRVKAVGHPEHRGLPVRLDMAAVDETIDWMERRAEVAEEAVVVLGPVLEKVPVAFDVNKDVVGHGQVVTSVHDNAALVGVLDDVAADDGSLDSVAHVEVHGIFAEVALLSEAVYLNPLERLVDIWRMQNDQVPAVEGVVPLRVDLGLQLEVPIEQCHLDGELVVVELGRRVGDTRLEHDCARGGVGRLNLDLVGVALGGRGRCEEELGPPRPARGRRRPDVEDVLGHDGGIFAPGEAQIVEVHGGVEAIVVLMMVVQPDLIPGGSAGAHGSGHGLFAVDPAQGVRGGGARAALQHFVCPSPLGLDIAEAQKEAATGFVRVVPPPQLEGVLHLILNAGRPEPVLLVPHAPILMWALLAVEVVHRPGHGVNFFENV